MKVINNAGRIIMSVMMAVLLTILTASCGKDSEIKRTNVENLGSRTQVFSTGFFNKYNLPYQKLSMVDVENTADEYLFYIPKGEVYRTLNDYVVVIVERSAIRESEELVGKDYSGELYNIFENDSVDVLKYSACGDFAIMCSMGTIPNWEQSEIIANFMEFAKDYEG